ncbi:MAG: hypothetical protein A2189_06025 [Paenibacillus sp. RIFOXYA1_FULL_44_5]|nr:MAG: hypothetical protein A2189_06025 [Paenibacillus sp. RIFOXYA1_FULL_44_5]
MSEPSTIDWPSQKTLTRWLQPILPYLIIWGGEWMVFAGLKYAGQWKNTEWIISIIAVLAVLLSAWTLYRQLHSVKTSGLSFTPIKLAVPFLVLLLSTALLQHIQAVEPYFVDFFRIQMLIFFYLVIGALGIRPLIWMGLWLFALSWIAGIWYLGYSVFILSFCGGLSLVASAWIVQMYRNQAA